MDMFTGKKIADLRKFNSLSQEALAEKLGVSRQAISKWERGEASPDMENFSALAGIFGVTVDDLLGDKKAHELFDFESKKQPQPVVAEVPENVDITGAATVSQPNATAENESFEAPVVTVVEVTEAEKKAPSEKAPKKIRGRAKRLLEKKERTHFKPKVKRAMNLVPVFLIVPIAYVLLNMKLQLWHPTWLLFFILPVYYFTAFAFNASNKRGFFLKLPVPFLLIGIYLCFGFVKDLWHPMWIIFLILPVYYWVAYHIKKD